MSKGTQKHVLEAEQHKPFLPQICPLCTAVCCLTRVEFVTALFFQGKHWVCQWYPAVYLCKIWRNPIVIGWFLLSNNNSIWVEMNISISLRCFTALTASDKRAESAQLSFCILILKINTIFQSHNSSFTSMSKTYLSMLKPKLDTCSPKSFSKCFLLNVLSTLETSWQKTL